MLEDVCIGCGACDFSCPTGALAKTDSFLGLFVIDPFTCDDCGICVPKCPVAAIEPDPKWAVCHGHGCPLTSKRLSEFECAIWQSRCPGCGATMWVAVGGELVCSRCDLGMKVSCPKARELGRSTAVGTAAAT